MGVNLVWAEQAERLVSSAQEGPISPFAIEQAAELIVLNLGTALDDLEANINPSCEELAPITIESPNEDVPEAFCELEHEDELTPLILDQNLNESVQQMGIKQIQVTPQSRLSLPLYRLFSTEFWFRKINDNHFLAEGNDHDFSFSLDFGLDLMLQNRFDRDSGFRIGLDSSNRFYSIRLFGGADLYPEDNRIELFVLDKDGILSSDVITAEGSAEAARLLERFGEDYNYIRNQAPLSVEQLKLDIGYLPNPDTAFGLNLGTINLNDRPDSRLAKIQIGHHYPNMYNFNNEFFGEMIVGGISKYLFLSPYIQKRATIFSSAVGTSQVVGKAQLDTNILLNHEGSDEPRDRLKPFSPRVGITVEYGIFPLDDGGHILNLSAGVDVAPWDKVPEKVDPGVIGSYEFGLGFRYKIGDQFFFKFTPVTMYVPINQSRTMQDILADKVYSPTLGREVYPRDRGGPEINTTWGTLNLKWYFNRPNRTFRRTDFMSR